MTPDLVPAVATLTERRFLVLLVGLSVLFAALPFVLGLLSAPSGGAYLGYQYNTDDHMVYSAWMRQAVDGRFFMDNRFTTDVQPSLTVNIYFFVLGLIAKVTGIPAASNLSRLFFSGLFVVLAYRLIRRLGWEESTSRLAAVLTVIGGGLGFMVWHMFGVAIVRPSPLSDILNGKLPIDVWQPEAFVFPSMLTNGLFMVSLCLIVFAFMCFLDAKDSWKPVAPGAVALCILMNIHSYDVLILALVMGGFLVATFMRKEVTAKWVVRAAAIAAGALPSALWFLHVIKVDPVFQARAATDTPSASFRAVVFGYLLLMAFALTGLCLRPTDDKELKSRRMIGAGLALLLFVGMFVAAGSSTAKYFLDSSGWVLVTVVALAAVAMLADENPAVNLVISWAMVGTVAIYFPGLFQRKLAMGLSVPWAILAAYGVHALLCKQEKSIRTMVTAMAAILMGATSLRWLAREAEFIKDNTSRTSVQTVFLDPSATKIMAYLNGLKGRHVLIAPPGVPSQAFKDGSQENGQVSIVPLIPDLNPVASGLTGIYTYAGHWSETPDYDKRRGLVQTIYFGNVDDDVRKALIQRSTADYAIALNPKAFPFEGLADLRKFGDVVVDGEQFRLIRLR